MTLIICGHKSHTFNMACTPLPYIYSVPDTTLHNRENERVPHIILFDGICNLCSKTVQFIIRNDKKAIFRFASLQSEVGKTLLRRYGLPSENHSTFVYIRGHQYYTKSTAALKVLKELGGGYKLLYAFILIPPFIRNAVYQVIAVFRYRLFGKTENCMLPGAELRKRFLDKT